MKPYSAQVQANAAGVGEADLTPPAGYQWLVYQISVSATGAGPHATTAAVYLNQRFVCGTNIGVQDSADGSPVPVRTGDTLRVVWASAAPGSTCNVQVLVEELLMGRPLQTIQ